MLTLKFCLSNCIEYKVIWILIYNEILSDLIFRLQFLILYKNWKICKHYKDVTLLKKHYLKSNNNYRFHNNTISNSIFSNQSIKIILEISNTTIEIITTIKVVNIIKINSKINAIINFIFNHVIFRRSINNFKINNNNNNDLLKHYFQNKHYNKKQFKMFLQTHYF